MQDILISFMYKSCDYLKFEILHQLINANTLSLPRSTQYIIQRNFKVEMYVTCKSACNFTKYIYICPSERHRYHKKVGLLIERPWNERPLIAGFNLVSLCLKLLFTLSVSLDILK